MFVTVLVTTLHVGVPAIPPAVLAPELDFASLQNPDQRAKSFSIYMAFRLASGTELESSEDGAQMGIPALGTPQEAADLAAWFFGRQGIRYRQDGTKITLFDIKGDRITGIRVWCKGNKKEQMFVPQLTVRWVLRVPPKVTWAFLGPAPRGGPLMGRAAAGLFAGVMGTVAAPEIDFTTLPKECREPRVLHLWVYPRLASGAVKIIHADNHSDPFPGSPGAVRQGILTFEHLYEMRVADSGSIALLRRFTPKDTGVLDYDPVVGLAVRSNGPVPALRWTLRPEYRDLFRKN